MSSQHPQTPYTPEQLRSPSPEGLSTSQDIAAGVLSGAGVNPPESPVGDSYANDMSIMAELYYKDPFMVGILHRRALLERAGDHNQGGPDARSRYYDAALQLTLSLDNAAFPPDPQGVVRRGHVNYLPDGYTYLGPSNSLKLSERSSEGTVADKQEIIEKYKADLLDILSDDSLFDADRATQDKILTKKLAMLIHTTMPYNHDIPKNKHVLGTGAVFLSSMDSGVCRHHAIAFQVLAQFLGVRSRLFRNTVRARNDNGQWSNPGHHLANIIEIGDEWWVIDVTNPDREKVDDSITKLHLMKVQVEGAPAEGQQITYSGWAHHRKREVEYTAHDIKYWRVKDMPRHRARHGAAK